MEFAAHNEITATTGSVFLLRVHQPYTVGNPAFLMQLLKMRFLICSQFHKTICKLLNFFSPVISETIHGSPLRRPT